MELLKSFWLDESGQGLTEYSVILGLVSVSLLIVLVALRDQIGRLFNLIQEDIHNRPGFGQADIHNRPGVGQADIHNRPGVGQGAGCPSVDGCKPRDGG